MKKYWIGAVSLFIGALVWSGVYERNRKKEEIRQSEIPIRATVLEEQYDNPLTPEEIFDDEGSLSHVELTWVSKYSLKLKTEEGRILGLSIIDTEDQTKESLDRLVSVGTEIEFPTGNMIEGIFGTGRDINETWFYEDTQIGTKYASRVKVIE